MNLNMISKFINKDSIILGDLTRKTIKNKVNLHYYQVNNSIENLGDYLSVVVVDWMTKYFKINTDVELSKTKHLYAIGSIIMNGFQNCTIWGTGFLNDVDGSRLSRWLKHYRKFDIRAVRGTKTYDAFKKLGFDCPEVFGDPAILMPLIYKPVSGSDLANDYVVIKHMSDNRYVDNNIDILTTDYAGFIDKIVNSKLVISSSLHGIILAESYGIPAVLYLPENINNTLFKYEDYYYGTGRYKFPVARSVDEALKTKPCELPDIKVMQNDLINSFPHDIYL